MTKQPRFPWVATSAVVSIGVVAAVVWLEVPSIKHNGVAPASRPRLTLDRVEPALHGDVLAEKLAAYDPAPLFIPSEWNSTEASLPDEARPEAGGPFAPIPPELTKTAALAFPPPVPVPRSVVEGLRLATPADEPLALARGDFDVRPLGQRLAHLEAVKAETGEVVLAIDLPLVGGLPEADWQPLELVGAVTRSGLAGELVVIQSSGVEEIDQFFRDHLRRKVRVGQRLTRGFWVFRIGP